MSKPLSATLKSAAPSGTARPETANKTKKSAAAKDFMLPKPEPATRKN